MEIIEAEVCPGHIHMQVSIPPKISGSGIAGLLKGKNSLIIIERHVNVKYRHGNSLFWCRGNYVDTAGRNAGKTAGHIQNQLKEDRIEDQMTLREYTDPFTSSKKQAPAAVRPPCALRHRQ